MSSSVDNLAFTSIVFSNILGQCYLYHNIGQVQLQCCCGPWKYPLLTLDFMILQNASQVWFFGVRLLSRYLYLVFGFYPLTLFLMADSEEILEQCYCYWYTVQFQVCVLVVVVIESKTLLGVCFLFYNFTFCWHILVTFYDHIIRKKITDRSCVILMVVALLSRPIQYYLKAYIGCFISTISLVYISLILVKLKDNIACYRWCIREDLSVMWQGFHGLASHV